ncbi:MAG: hypothetical protein ABI233_03850 [Chthoniobacterales bacterium]
MAALFFIQPLDFLLHVPFLAQKLFALLGEDGSVAATKSHLPRLFIIPVDRLLQLSVATAKAFNPLASVAGTLRIPGMNLCSRPIRAPHLLKANNSSSFRD